MNHELFQSTVLVLLFIGECIIYSISSWGNVFNKKRQKPLDFDLFDKQIKEMFPMKKVEDGRVFKIDFNGYTITLYKNEMLPEQYAMLSTDLYDKVFNHFKNQVK